jgi:hypothetical protein
VLKNINFFQGQKLTDSVAASVTKKKKQVFLNRHQDDNFSHLLLTNLFHQRGCLWPWTSAVTECEEHALKEKQKRRDF